MSLRKMIRESVIQFANKKTDEQAFEILRNLNSSIEQHGLSYLHWDFFGNKKTFVIDIGSKDKTHPYSISLDVAYNITKKAHIERGNFGSTDTAVAPYSEAPEWKMYLRSGSIFDDNGNIIYQGDDVFNEMFKNLYGQIHDFFNDKVVEEEY